MLIETKYKRLKETSYKSYL